MSNRILLVDDEPSLLNGIVRRLESEFDLETASSGAAALRIIDEQGPFALIITDMRMPVMDGLQFIKAARPRAGEAVFIMLTGNQDLQTATRALNEGQVFRFLTKPCLHEDLKAAITAGLRQHQLISAEKELLRSTLLGSIDMLTEALALTRPCTHAWNEQLQDLFTRLCARLEFPFRWEFATAAKLAFVGFCLMPEKLLDQYLRQEKFGYQEEVCLAQGFAMTARLTSRIPRLETVSAILQGASRATGKIDTHWSPLDAIRSSTSMVSLGSSLLRLCVLATLLRQKEVEPAGMPAQIREIMPDVDDSVLDELTQILDAPREQHQVGRRVTLDELQPGMLLTQDIESADGKVLRSAGQVLTNVFIEGLKHWPQPVSEICVVDLWNDSTGQQATGAPSRAAQTPALAAT